MVTFRKRAYDAFTMRWRVARWVGFVAVLALSVQNGSAFSGFYVAKAPKDLFNQASRIVMARHDGKTVLSLMHDYQGELTEFALVIPVPELLKEGQIHVGDRRLFERIDAFTSPRLVETYDPNPCQKVPPHRMNFFPQVEKHPVKKAAPPSPLAQGVTVEARYTVGEYDLVILSAKESKGMESWLKRHGYRIPSKADRILKSYVKKGYKFVVAKVNLAAQVKTGLTYLRPLQLAYVSEDFVLPIRLGMLNAKKGPQELIAYILTERGRVEPVNYRTVKIPSSVELPLFVRDRFSSFYSVMFDRLAEKQKNRVVFLEYVWNMGWCDPCAADPLTPRELRQLGVFWLTGPKQVGSKNHPRRIMIPRPITRGPIGVQVTRLRFRYTPKGFPEDVSFKETNDRGNFQGRYVLRHPWKGDITQCEEAQKYYEKVARRDEEGAKTLASLTGWDINEIRKNTHDVAEPTSAWWEGIWE